MFPALAGTNLAIFALMKRSDSSLRCYTAAFHNTEIDPYLESRGFTHGMITFSIPTYGILFRCRTQGELIDLEFAALFALLKFLKTRLADTNVKAVTIFTSNPELVFSFTGSSRHLETGSERARLIGEYCRQFKISIVYIEPKKNQTLISPADYPTFSDQNDVDLTPDNEDINNINFKPFQKGIKF